MLTQRPPGRMLLLLTLATLLFSAPSRAQEPTATPPGLEQLLATGTVKGSIKQLWGGNDVKFIVRLDDGSKKGLKAIFRPEHLEDEWKHRKEIAAYRLAMLCGIENVPITVARSFPESMFKRSGEKTQARLAFRDDLLAGALQLFVTGAHDPLGEDGFAWAKERLLALSVPGQPFTMDPSEARQFSRLLVFDYLQSNPDRFSGGNLLQGEDGTFWFIDNADTYYACYRIRKRLNKLCHFDRQLVNTLRQLSEAQLQSHLGKLLGPKQVGRIWKRVQIVLARVDGLIAEHGEARVLF